GFGCGIQQGTTWERWKCPSSRPISSGATTITTPCTSPPRLRCTACQPRPAGSCPISRIDVFDPGRPEQVPGYSMAASDLFDSADLAAAIDAFTTLCGD